MNTPPQLSPAEPSHLVLLSPQPSLPSLVAEGASLASLVAEGALPSFLGHIRSILGTGVRGDR